MGATLRYAKVVDSDHLQAHGGLSPSTDNVVMLREKAPAIARDFLVLRAWDRIEGGVDEGWRLEDPHGQVVYNGAPRTVLAQDGDVFDEVQGVRFEYSDDAYQLVLEIDGREVARAGFAVVVAADAPSTPPETADADLTPPEATDEGDRPAPNEPTVIDLTADEQRVFEAVARIETGGTPGFAQDVAREAGVDDETARTALSGLTGHHDLVQEVSTGTGDGPDTGPRYRVKARP